MLPQDVRFTKEHVKCEGGEAANAGQRDVQENVALIFYHFSHGFVARFDKGGRFFGIFPCFSRGFRID